MKAYPNIFEVIELIKKEEAASAVTVSQLAGGSQIPARKKVSIEKDGTARAAEEAGRWRVLLGRIH